jgi:thiol-disulfide isomerase/thioredoxin
MVKRTLLLIGLTALALVASPTFALDLGEPAPALKADWIRGGPHDIKAGKGKNVFVLEFWATWCGPCRMSMPHLSELQKKYKDKGLVVIGVAMSEEPASLIKSFLSQMGDKVAFPIALDKNNETARAYMMALGVQAIPYSFVIDKDGLLAWHGSPFGEIDQVIEQCLAGTFNLKARQALMKYFETAVEADNTDNPDRRKELAKKTKELGEDLLKVAAKSPSILDLLAWNIVSLPVLKTRDMGLARRASKTAYDATEGKDASILDTYARILWDSGEKVEAVKMQRQAVELAKGKEEQLVAGMKVRLKEYEAGAKDLLTTTAPATQASK